MTSSIVPSSLSSAAADPPVKAVASKYPKLEGSPLGRSFCDSNLFEPHLVKIISEMEGSVCAFTLIKELTRAGVYSPSNYNFSQWQFRIPYIRPILTTLFGEGTGWYNEEQARRVDRNLQVLAERINDVTPEDLEKAVRNSRHGIYPKKRKTVMGYVVKHILYPAVRGGHRNVVDRFTAWPFFSQLDYGSLSDLHLSAIDYREWETCKLLGHLLVTRDLKQLDSDLELREETFQAYSFIPHLQDLLQVARIEGRKDYVLKLENRIQQIQNGRRLADVVVIIGLIASAAVLAHVIFRTLLEQTASLSDQINFTGL